MNNVYFVGIGGIGMSALARYYKMKGYEVSGYDRTPSVITDALQAEGITINFLDDEKEIASSFRNAENTLVVYTPAIPHDSLQLNFFQKNGFKILKRAQVLGELSRQHKALCIAGTHGKTTVSTLLAFLLHESHIGCNAFLGGISTNFGTNVLLNDQSEYIVIEADEFDRSFLQLSPFIAGITSMDADHLDIYQNKEALIKTFNDFAEQIDEKGLLFIKEGLHINRRLIDGTYSVNGDSLIKAVNLRHNHGIYTFDYIGKENKKIENLTLGVLGKVNVENAVLAITIALEVGVTSEEIRAALPRFAGVYRRFNLHVNDKVIYIDDYAHHPRELEALLSSIREIWPDRKLNVCFQPHLYSRTQDFYKEFAVSLNLADKVFLLPIYPARELPIAGVTSRLIMENMTSSCEIVEKDELFNKLVDLDENDVFVTAGAGDIDRLVLSVKSVLSGK